MGIIREYMEMRMLIIWVNIKLILRRIYFEGKNPDHTKEKMSRQPECQRHSWVLNIICSDIKWQLYIKPNTVHREMDLPAASKRSMAEICVLLNFFKMPECAASQALACQS